MIESDFRIMVVDDEKAQLVLLSAMTGSKDVDTFNDPLQALASFEANPRLYGLIFTDRNYKRPDINGEGFAARIRGLIEKAQLAPPPRLVMVTADVEDFNEEDFDRLEALGIDRVIGKPYRMAEIRAEVAIALAQRP